MITDFLHVIGAATLALGVIHESDGVQQHSFWLRNDGTSAISQLHGYTSCGCTTIELSKDSVVAPGDSVCVTLRFNPRGKTGEFHESAMVTYQPEGKVQMALEGECIPSAGSLQRQYPIPINDNLRLSKARFDIGVMRLGASRTLHVSVLHTDDNNRVETFGIPFCVTANMPKGLQHIERTLTTNDSYGEVEFKIILDVIIK